MPLSLTPSPGIGLAFKSNMFIRAHHKTFGPDGLRAKESRYCSAQMNDANRSQEHGVRTCLSGYGTQARAKPHPESPHVVLSRMRTYSCPVRELNEPVLRSSDFRKMGTQLCPLRCGKDLGPENDAGSFLRQDSCTDPAAEMLECRTSLVLPAKDHNKS
jgi:hypothetical protein